jgi:pimeloyl-ACP methyl ester carboxylesterase
MATYVLVGGAWLGAWAWGDVARDLRARGHDVHPVTLTGLGERAHLARPEIDLDTHVTDVVNVLVYEDLHEVVLVGHSYAGLVVTGVADRAPERLAQVVYLDTGPLPSGQSLLDFNPPEERERLRRLVDERGGGWLLPVPAFEDLGTPESIGDLGERQRALLEARATPQPFRTWTQPLDYREQDGPPYGRVLVLAGGWGLTAAQLREGVEGGDPALRLFEAPDWRFEELATGHWPMLSAPGATSALLDRLAAGTVPAASGQQQR